MTEFLSLLLGTTSLPMFAALFTFAMVGVLINLLFHATTRDQNSTDTPVQFSLKFLFTDNWKRIVLSVLLILVTIRFMSLFFDIEVIGNNELYLFGSLVVGFIFDKLGEIFKERTSFLKVRREPGA